MFGFGTLRVLTQVTCILCLVSTPKTRQGFGICLLTMQQYTIGARFDHLENAELICNTDICTKIENNEMTAY